MYRVIAEDICALCWSNCMKTHVQLRTQLGASQGSLEMYFHRSRIQSCTSVICGFVTGIPHHVCFGKGDFFFGGGGLKQRSPRNRSTQQNVV
jgi:hypothetical protein